MLACIRLLPVCTNQYQMVIISGQAKTDTETGKLIFNVYVTWNYSYKWYQHELKVLNSLLKDEKSDKILFISIKMIRSSNRITF